MPENDSPDYALMYIYTVKMAGIEARIGQVLYNDRFGETFFSITCDLRPSKYFDSRSFVIEIHNPAAFLLNCVKLWQSFVNL